jgi:hypothetical protein
LFALGRVAGNFGIGSGATVAGFIVASVQHLRAFQALYLFDAITCAALALIVLVAVPNRRLANAAAPSDSGTGGFRAVARDRLFLNTFFIVVAQIPATRVVKRMRRTHAFAATSGLWAIGLLGVLLAALTRSTLAATTVLAGVAIVIAIGECAQSTVLGPLVAELAPPHLLGRYMSLYSLTFTAALALGPAVGGVVLATSPDAVWWVGALVAAVIGAGFLLSSDRIPEPLAATASHAPGDPTPDTA